VPTGRADLRLACRLVTRRDTRLASRYFETLWDAGGTDVLLTVGAPPLLRIDGVLTPATGEDVLQPGEIETVLAQLVEYEAVERLRSDRQLDFSLSWQDRARVRGNAFLQRGHVAVALRMIPFVIPTFTQLGLPAIVERWASGPQGFLIVTGPTGAGKSTTLAAIVDHINRSRAVHVLTIEDPIEYLHHHQLAVVNQREVGVDVGSFGEALRSALREDPDVVLVGEMRDQESIQAALTIAETGHLVLTTLHANDTAQTLDRIIDVFPAVQQPQIRLQLASTLVGVLGQRLVPRIGGGRIAAFEVLVATTPVRNLIREGKTRQIRNTLATSQRDGMQTLETALSGLVADGLVAHEQAVAVSAHPDEVRPPAPVPIDSAPEIAGRRKLRRTGS
jgi:twitching motility protein PilT